MRGSQRPLSDLEDFSKDILKILRENGALKRREMADILGIKGDERIVLKQALHLLEDKGKIRKERKLYVLADTLPHVLPVRVHGQDEDGRYLAMPLNERYGTGYTIIISDKKLKRVAKGGVLSEGQALLVRLTAAHDASLGEDVYHAEVIKTLESRSDSFFALVVSQRNHYVVKPVQKKQADRTYFVGNPEFLSDYDIGSDVPTLVKVIPMQADRRAGGRRGDERVRVEAVLGSITDPRFYSMIAVAEHHLATDFPDSVEVHARDYVPKPALKREDWRHLHFVTIDPVDARDHDDAVFVMNDADSSNPDGFIIYVAIADVAAYVPIDSVIDREAQARGNSVYFPDGVVPMLPHQLSSDQCSLKPHQERNVFGVEMRITDQGHLLGFRFTRALIVSQANLAYEAAQRFFDEGVSDHPDLIDNPALRESLMTLKAANDALCIAREQRQPLHIVTQEQRIRVNAQTAVIEIEDVPHLYAHELIENMMVLANECAARTLSEARVPSLNRVHDAPDPLKLDNLRQALKVMGLHLPKGQHFEPKHFNAILKRVEGLPQEHLISELVLRSQSQAQYSPETIGHFGLNLRFYAHFTSPIRRYSDVITHRLLLSVLGENDGLQYSYSELKAIGEHLSQRERIAQAAERDTVNRLRIKGLETALGEERRATISGLSRFGVFAELDSQAEGFIPMRTLRPLGFRINDSASTLYCPKRKGQQKATYRLGDSIVVRIEDVHPLAGSLRLSLVV